MIGAQHGVVAAISSAFAMFYGLWLLLRRPVNMPVKIAVALTMTAAAFLVDTAITGEPYRLMGTIVAGGLAWWIGRSLPAHGDVVK
jgi:hypothetical protein